MKVLYAGDACTKIGPLFLASPFNLEVKGVSHHIWGQPLIDALQAGGHQVTHMTNESAIANFPRTVEGLKEYDVLIISDCECEVLSLYPFWMESAVQPTTNRLIAIREYVRQGGGLIMIGGWSSFSGRFGHGAYYDTPVEDALPVTCLKGMDDRLETPEGAAVTINVPDSPIVAGIPWDKCPGFEGFNRLVAKDGAQIIATVEYDEKVYPFIVAWELGKGRSMAFASDCSPHWAAHFQPWEYYGQFWRQAIEWLGGKDKK